MTRRTATPDVRSELEGFLRAGYLAANPPELQKLSIILYRSLARGAPVSLAELEETAAFSGDEIERLIALIPSSAFERRPDGAFTAFIGLSVRPTAHQFALAGRTLYTWCVFDALFLPAIVRGKAVLTTTCPATRQEIKVSITPEAAEAIYPREPVMSIIAPDRESCCSNLRAGFCAQVNFFADQETFSQWRQRRAADDCISLADAFDLAARRNEYRFPDMPLSDDR